VNKAASNVGTMDMRLGILNMEVTTSVRLVQGMVQYPATTTTGEPASIEVRKRWWVLSS
jgi:hypothetical protein